MEPLPDFTCAICRRNVDMRWASFRVQRNTPIPPFCGYCESSFTEGTGEPKQGSFRDRRETMRGFAVAEALRCEAAGRQWRHPHVYAA